MKIFLTAVLFTFFFQPVIAQEKTRPDSVNHNLFHQAWAIKWNPGSIPFGKIGLLGEYNFKKKRSLTFGIGIPIEKSSSITVDNEKYKLDSKTFSLMAGYRIYMGKKTMNGFYFEPYLKYVKNEMDSRIEAELDNSPVVFLSTSSYSGIGVGAQLGVQFIIAKRITLDLFFLGPEANYSDYSFLMKDITSTSWDAQDAADAQQEIDEQIGDLPIIGDKVKIKVDANARTVSSEYKGFLPGFRAGASIGIRF